MAKLDRNDGTVLTLGTVAALAVAGVWRYRSIPDPSRRGSSNHLAVGQKVKLSDRGLKGVGAIPKTRENRDRWSWRGTVIEVDGSSGYMVADDLAWTRSSVHQRQRSFGVQRGLPAYWSVDEPGGYWYGDRDLVAADSSTRKWPGTGYEGLKPKGSRAKSQTDRQRAIKAFAGAVRLGHEHISLAQARRLTKGHDVAEINEAALSIRLARTSHAPGGLGLEDPKGSKSGSLPLVHVKFKDARDNYTTQVSASTTQQKARKYFVGKRFDVGSYPQERLEEVIGIEYIPRTQPRSRKKGMGAPVAHTRSKPGGGIFQHLRDPPRGLRHLQRLHQGSAPCPPAEQEQVVGRERYRGWPSCDDQGLWSRHGERAVSGGRGGLDPWLRRRISQGVQLGTGRTLQVGFDEPRPPCACGNAGWPAGGVCRHSPRCQVGSIGNEP